MGSSPVFISHKIHAIIKFLRKPWLSVDQQERFMHSTGDDPNPIDLPFLPWNDFTRQAGANETAELHNAHGKMSELNQVDA
jgi:hypothetical protein